MKKLVVLFAFVALLVAPVFAQVTMIPTTFSSAVTSTSATQVVVTAATGLNSNSYAITAGSSYLYADGELMAVNAVNGTTLSVTRGYSGSRAILHTTSTPVFVGPANFFSSARPGLSAATGTACTANTFPAVPRPDVQSQDIYTCIGGIIVRGIVKLPPQFGIPFPNTGAVLYTGVGTGSAGTAPGSTTLYCTEINLENSKLLTGMAVLNGGTAATDKWIYALYDSAGTLLANTATAGTTASGTNVYQKIAFTSKYYAVGPAQYFGCLEGNGGGSSTVTMIKTGMQDTYLTKGQTGTTFGTLPALTVPTTFTSAVGPYWQLY